MRERRGEGAGVRRGGAKREARATTRAQVLVAQGHVNFAEGSVQSVKVDPSRIPKGPVSGLDHHWALSSDVLYFWQKSRLRRLYVLSILGKNSLILKKIVFLFLFFQK